MRPCPQIAVYRLQEGPRAAEWIARFVVAAPPKNGKPVAELLPIDFIGHSQHQVCDMARDWWSKEQVKENANRPLQRPTARRNLSASVKHS